MDIDEKKPKRTKKDVLYTIAKAGIAGIAYVGEPAAELFSQIEV